MIRPFLAVFILLTSPPAWAQQPDPAAASAEIRTLAPDRQAETDISADEERRRVLQTRAAEMKELRLQAEDRLRKMTIVRDGADECQCARKLQATLQPPPPAAEPPSPRALAQARNAACLAKAQESSSPPVAAAVTILSSPTHETIGAVRLSWPSPGGDGVMRFECNFDGETLAATGPSEHKPPASAAAVFKGVEATQGVYKGEATIQGIVQTRSRQPSKQRQTEGPTP